MTHTSIPTLYKLESNFLRHQRTFIITSCSRYFVLKRQQVWLRSTTFSSLGNLSSMAGLIASLFKSPQLCRLSGVSLQARSATEGSEFLYAALYFHTMTSLVSDDFRERWRITECSCHISLTQHEMMPRYDRRTIYNLRQEFQRWKSIQNSVEATLQYSLLGERTDPQSRLVKSVFPDQQSSLFKLLGQLHHILFENTISSCPE